VGDQNRSFEARVFIDGGFAIHKNGLRFPDVLDTEELMVTATLELAYSLIPRVNALYVADAPAWAVRRIEVIESAMEDLEQRYRNARAALRERMESSPKLVAGA